MIHTHGDGAAYCMAAALLLVSYTIASQLSYFLKLLLLIYHGRRVLVDADPLQLVHVKDVHVVEFFCDFEHASEDDHVLASD